LVLGAILGPTDPVAATSVLRRVGAPDRLYTILEGEALVNDGTGLTVYKLAVAAVVSGHFSPGLGVIKFVGVSVGGVAIGLPAVSKKRARGPRDTPSRSSERRSAMPAVSGPAIGGPTRTAGATASRASGRFCPRI
jgi:hypothetical protein